MKRPLLCKGGVKTMDRKSLISVGILIFLLASVVTVADSQESEHLMKFTSAEQIHEATNHYVVLITYSRSSDRLASIMIILDNPDTPEVGDAVAVIRNGELEEFWEKIDGELRMVFRKAVKRIETHII